ncbi:MAG TPA: galactose-1-phosphate uridylyltransferase [Gemmataceae bacterium]|nr:galactose-1-phosphate uridylyltransferase [Gemmataceae bacterium]
MQNDVPFHVPSFRIRSLAAPELRKDPLLDHWVIVSTDRLSRALELHASTTVTPLDACPFCGGNEQLTTAALLEIPDGLGGWRVRVVPNLYPAVRSDVPAQAWNDGWHEGARAVGRHEVIVEYPQHETAFANLKADQVAEVLRAYCERLQAAKKDARLAFAMVFKNSGADAGASLEHVHSQILILPQIPRTVQEELEGAKRHFDATGRCFFCDWWRIEKGTGVRQLFDTPRFSVFLPYAGRFPCEMCILPKEHQSHFEDSNDEARRELGEVLRTALRKLKRGLNDPPYNYLLHTAPLRAEQMPHYHWHLEVLPRLTGVAGFEWGTGYFVNPVPPEQAAAYLRGVEA